MFGNMGAMMKKAQDMQKKMTEAQEKLKDVMVEGSSGSGMVTATISAAGDMKSIKIDPSLVDPEDIEMLEDLIMAALKDAQSKAEATSAEAMGKITGGLKLPGGMKLPL